MLDLAQWLRLKLREISPAQIFFAYKLIFKCFFFPMHNCIISSAALKPVPYTFIFIW